MSSLLLCSQHPDCFSRLSISGSFSTFGFIVSTHFYFCNRVLSSFRMQVCGTMHVSVVDSPKNTTKQNHSPLPTLVFGIISCTCFHLRPTITSHTRSTLVRYLVPLLRRGLLIGWWWCLRCFLQVRDIGKVILLGHTNGQSQDHQLPLTGSPSNKHGKEIETAKRTRGQKGEWMQRGGKSDVKKVWCRGREEKRGHFK